MSSMWRAAVLTMILLAIAPSSSAQYSMSTTSAPGSAYYAGQSVASALQTWRTLRQSSGYRFSDYAGFLIANPDWPEAARMRGWAERAMQPGENPGLVRAFFAAHQPKTGNGWARLAEAYEASSQRGEAFDAARRAWSSADLSSDDEQTLWSRYGASFTRADADARLDVLLLARRPADAARFLSMATPERQAAFGARIAMQENLTDAESRYRAAMGNVTSDAGLMIDRARWLRNNNYGSAAQQLFARDHAFTYKPVDPQRFLDELIALSSDAVADRNWQAAFNIARQMDDAFPAGTSIPDQPTAIRDDYTTLAWLAGSVALDRLNHPASAVAMFDRYARAGRALQVRTKGFYWAGRAALAAGRFQDANGYFEQAAAYPDLFYGQLALERLGRSVPPPPAALPQYVASSVQRTAFNSRRIVQAVRLLGEQNRPSEQALFVKALAEQLDNDTERNLAVELGQQIGRDDVAVWTSRMARVKGSSFYVRQAYPTLRGNVSADLWSLAHGISRQESSFDSNAVSHAGARGLMQLMTGTAREQAGKMGVGFDTYRLTSDPNYNVLLGSAYFNRLLNSWNGSIPLAVAAYNAGSGNVRKWIDRYGDPRSQVDILKWIETIPYSETRAYVQRVIENSVIYDSIRSTRDQQAAIHVSRYLGKNRPA